MKKNPFVLGDKVGVLETDGSIFSSWDKSPYAYEVVGIHGQATWIVRDGNYRDKNANMLVKL